MTLDLLEVEYRRDHHNNVCLSTLVLVRILTIAEINIFTSEWESPLTSSGQI